jgi:hypothetical protein
MSVENAKLRLEHVPLKGDGKLRLSKNLLKQIDYLHKQVGNVEWSGILLYKIEAGDIGDPTTLDIIADKLVLMDVGTSGYTEYEYNADDPEMLDTVSTAVEAGYRLGHIHTH